MDVGALLKDIYRPQVEQAYPELVTTYGYDAVWSALGEAEPGPCMFCVEVW